MGSSAEQFDVVVVGGGAAGSSGAKILARMRRSVLVIDAGRPRNAPALGVHNYLYAEGASPSRLAALGRAEAAGYGVQVIEAAATSATVLEDPTRGGPRFAVTLRGGPGDSPDGGADGERTVTARRVLLATGVVDVLPDIPGLAGRWGQEVLHCPFCHGWEVRDQAIGIISTGPMAVHSALLFRQLSADVVLFAHTGPELTAEQREQLAAWDVDVVAGEVAAVETTGGALSGVRLADGRLVARQAVAVATTLQGRQDLLADLGLAMSDLEVAGTVLGQHLAVDPNGATAVSGVWAAGNIAAPMAQVIGAAASGATAGAAMHMDLLTEDTAIAVAARAGANLIGA